MSGVRVRFAPSPTGLLHIGGARTALFNWVYARHAGGAFVLRVEDTDAARNTDAAVRIIIDGLRWLGLDWDEGPGKDGGCGPYFQSQRRAIYNRYIDRLLAEGRAYADEGAVRFRTPKTPCVVRDLICGDVGFDRKDDPDLVVRRSDGSPVFHLVNVVDDLEMRITHVIRGEDHLSNTPKHLALFEAFGAEPPRYAHIPLILNRDGSKMSKRDAGSSLGEYMDKGYLPEAVRNYLCLLGWSPKDDREKLDIAEVVARFDLAQVNRANARFDAAKLSWLNGQYQRAMPPSAFATAALPFLVRAGLAGPDADPAALQTALGLCQEKVETLADLPAYAGFLFGDEVAIDPEARAQKLDAPGARDLLRALRDRLAAAPDFQPQTLEAALKALASDTGQKAAAYVHPCRVAVSGRTTGPSLYHMLEVLGRDRVLARIDRALAG